MLTTAEQVSLMFKDVIPANVLAQKISDSAVIVSGDGFSVSDDSFEILNRYYTAHLLELTGYRPSVASESIDDISRSYQKGRMNPGETGFLLIYRQILSTLGGGEEVGIGIGII